MDALRFDYFYKYTHAENTHVDKHYHNCYELVYYLSGSGYSTCGDTVFQFKSGDYIIYPYKLAHDEHHTTGVSVICIGFTIPEGYDYTIPMYQGSDNTNLLFNMIEKLRHEIQARQLKYKTMADLLTTEIIIRIERLKTKNAGDYDDFAYMLQYIHENLANDLNNTQLAAISGYSPDHFRHYFKKRTGTSPKQYITEKRLELAKILLTSSTMPVSRICYMCGFPDLSQFCASFKKHTGIPPQEYRKNAK